MKKRQGSFACAYKGIKAAMATQPNLRIHFTMAAGVVAAGFFFEISAMEWMVCLLCIAMVIAAELLNSAVESVVNLLSPDYHKLAGRAKDMAAGGVLVCAVFSVFIGLLVFLPRILAMFGG